MKKKLHCDRIVIIAVCISFIALPAGDAGAINTQIQTDHTLPGITAFSKDVPGNHQVYTLSEIHGKTAGNNLFYSFSGFNIDATDSAWFNLNTPDLENVISRVTGGFESVIEGTLKMTNTGSAPAFFLINSAGITFGSGASVDVPGAFYTSTANALNLDYGSQYLSSEADVSTLSAADPVSFGFLGDESGKINIGSFETGQTNLSFKPGTDVGFIANQIQIDNATVTNKDTSQAGINLQIVTTGEEAGQIKLGTFVEDQITSGKLNIHDSSINASGNGSGHLAIQSGNFTASNSDLSVDNTGKVSMTQGHGVVVNSDSIILSNDASISSNTSSQGNAGTIVVDAGRLEIDNSEISSMSIANFNGEFGEVSGDAGNVTVLVTDTLQIINAGRIRSSTYTSGNAGEMTVTAGELELILGNISSDTQNQSSNNLKDFGNAGNITVAVTGDLKMSGGSRISADTFSTGNAGNVTITANNLIIDGSGSSIVSGALSNGGLNNTGDAGNIMIDVSETIRLINGGTIDSSTQSEGSGGDVVITAKNIEIVSTEDSFESAANRENVSIGDTRESTGIFSNSLNIDPERNPGDRGDAGNIMIRVEDTLKLIGSSSVINSSTLSKGNAGDVTITAGQLEIDGQNTQVRVSSGVDGQYTQVRGSSGVFSQSINFDSRSIIISDTGDAGNVTVSVTDTFKLINKGNIGTSIFSTTGNAGTIVVDAGRLEIDNSEISSIINSAGSTGERGGISIKAGNEIRLSNNAKISIENAATIEGLSDLIPSLTSGAINIDTVSLSLTDSDITANSSGNVDAGEISITVTDQLHLDQSTISTRTINGSGGDIGIGTEERGDIVYLLDSAITTSVEGQSGNGNGGNINIKANSLAINTGFIQANTAAPGASGGDINIGVSALVPSSNFLQIGGNTPAEFLPFSGRNVIQAAALGGESGTISPIIAQLNLSGVLTNLAIESFDSNALNRNMCTVDEGSSLFQSGKGGMRIRARDFLLSPML